jgi:hypothetical protein
MGAIYVAPNRLEAEHLVFELGDGVRLGVTDRIEVSSVMTRNGDQHAARCIVTR